MAWNNQARSLGVSSNGDIRVSRIVTIVAGGNLLVEEADANEICFGVAHEGDFTNDSAYAGLAAKSGDEIQIYKSGVCKVVAGGTVDEGELIKSDADGRAVAALATGTVVQQVLGVCCKAAAVGEMCEVDIRPQALLPAVA